MHLKLAGKQAALVNKWKTILLHDNATPRASRLPAEKLHESEYEVLPYPAYSLIILLRNFYSIAQIHPLLQHKLVRNEKFLPHFPRMCNVYKTEIAKLIIGRRSSNHTEAVQHFENLNFYIVY